MTFSSNLVLLLFLELWHQDYFIEENSKRQSIFEWPKEHNYIGNMGLVKDMFKMYLFKSVNRIFFGNRVIVPVIMLRWSHLEALMAYSETPGILIRKQQSDRGECHHEIVETEIRNMFWQVKATKDFWKTPEVRMNPHRVHFKNS